MPIHVKSTHLETSWGGRLHLSMLIQTLKTTLTLPGLAWQQITRLLCDLSCTHFHGGATNKCPST